MNPKSIDLIFWEAAQLPGERERKEYLDRACGDSATLRERVEQLLLARGQADDFLESPVLSPVATVDEPITERPGAIIGRYKLLEQIGEGGFGVVFMAEQQHPVRRKVALKVIKPGMDTRQVIARFEAERQALALMDHPNIARVLDAGTTGNPKSEARNPKQIQSTKSQISNQAEQEVSDIGASNLRFVSDFEFRASDLPQGRPYFVMELVRGASLTDYCDQHNVPIRGRLELFLDICQAVQHAHQKGIIHRDIKPSNVLVTLHDGKPVVKVIDFGIAKAMGQQLTDKTLFTNFAQMIGTPLYMSPEQAEMSGLDVDTRSDIYSLGVLLYELLTGTTPFDKERLKQAGFDEIRRIIREEEPPKPSTRISTLDNAATTVSTQRKSDPKRLSQVLRGELDWIVMKCLEKDRNRRYETASGLAADVQHYLKDEPVLACPPSSWYRLRKFARRNKTALAIASMVLLCMAVVGGGGGWLMRDRAARQWEADSKTLEALEAAEPRLLDGQPGDPALLAAAQRMKAALESDNLSPEIRQRAEQLRRDVCMLGELDEIRRRQAESKGGEMFDSAGAEKQYADAFSVYGIDVATLEPSQAAAWVRASAIREALLAGLDAWMQLTTAQDQAHAWLQAVADEADDSAWRRTFRRAALAGDTKQLKELARQPEALAQPPTVLAWLGSVLDAAGLPEDAATILRQAQQRYPADFWINYDLGHFLIFGPAPHPDEAVGYFRAAVAARPQSAEARSILGLALHLQGDIDGAIAAFQHAIALDPEFATARCNLAGSLRQKGQLDEAIAAYREAIRVGPRFHEARLFLANFLKDKGQLDEAIAEYREILRLQNDFAQSQAHRYRLPTQRKDYDRHLKRFAEARSNLVNALKERAYAYNQSGQSDKAIADLTDALDTLSKAIKLDPKSANAWWTRGWAYNEMHQYDDAVADFTRAIELDPRMAMAWSGRGFAHLELKQLDKAIADCSKAIELDPKDWLARIYRGWAYSESGQDDDAIADFTKAMELDPKNSAAWIHRGNVYCELRQYDKGMADFSKAIELAPKLAAPRYLRAVLCLKLGDRKGYRQVCEAVLESSRDAPPEAARLAPWTCVLGPDSGVESACVLELAEKLASQNPKNRSDQTIFGAALYRAGRFEDAERRLNQAAALPADPFQTVEYTWLFLAMAHQRLGHAKETREWLEKSRKQMEERAKDADVTWNRRLTLELLRGEAEALLGIKEKKESGDRGQQTEKK